MLKIKLYPCFNRWLEFNNIFLLSDPHFSDPEMIHLRKNYISDEEQVKRINAKVGKKDLLICLGDVGDISFISKLRAGYKVLIKGNHDDKGDAFYKREKHIQCGFNSDTHELAEKYIDNRLFDEVYSGPVWIAEKILLSHERIDLPFVFNIYGHHHGDPINNDHLMCICAEHIDYTPVSLLKLIKDGTFSKVDTIHRVTIDRATERKLNKKKNNS